MGQRSPGEAEQFLERARVSLSRSGREALCRLLFSFVAVKSFTGFEFCSKTHTQKSLLLSSIVLFTWMDSGRFPRETPL